MMPNAYASNNSIKLCEAKLRKLHKEIGKSISTVGGFHTQQDQASPS